jgi:hypothetical protein
MGIEPHGKDNYVLLTNTSRAKPMIVLVIIAVAFLALDCMN